MVHNTFRTCESVGSYAGGDKMDLNETMELMRDKIMEQIPNATEIEKGSGYLSPGQILEHMDKISPPARLCPANQDRYSILKPEEKCKDRFVS